MKVYTDVLVIRVKRLHEQAKMPEYKSNDASGCVLYAVENTELAVKKISCVRTGLALEIPCGWHAILFSVFDDNDRIVICSPTLSPDQRGEVIVPIVNMGPETKHIGAQSPVAKMVLHPSPQALMLDSTEFCDMEQAGLLK